MRGASAEGRAASLGSDRVRAPASNASANFSLALHQATLGHASRYNRTIFEFNNQPNETALTQGDLTRESRYLVGAGFDSGNRDRRSGIS